LSGRIDSLEARPNGWFTIKDYKTGATSGARREVHDVVAKQLRLYGLMILERIAGAHIELMVDDGAEVVIPFADEQIDDTRAWLAEVLERLPGRESRSAASLANPGPACAGCSIRHVCVAYRAAAPELWRVGTDVTGMPIDTWGVVSSSTTGNDRTLTLELDDAAGRRVKIFRLDRRHAALETVRPGDELWFFGLCGLTSQGADRRWRHPRNFWEVPGDATQKHAWSLAVFSATAS
jgi:hypothetical protein